MYKTISDAQQIARAQAEFERLVRSAAKDSRMIPLGHQGGGREVMVHFLKHLNFWVGIADSRNRYWNALGIGDPFEDSHSIIAEINPPKSGIDRRISGLFVRDHAGKVHLAHRGRIGGGRKGIGKTAFLAWYTQPTDLVDDGGEYGKIVVIGALDDGSLLEDLATFTRNVAAFKDQAVARAPH